MHSNTGFVVLTKKKQMLLTGEQDNNNNMSLHLRYLTKYSIKLIANKEMWMFGDVAFNESARFACNKQTNELKRELFLRCNDKLADYPMDQRVFIKAIMWTPGKPAANTL